MFVGFIAVVVILLVIVGLMSSGATSGSGGVDQTKATKMLGEISGLAQAAGFYKTTNANSNYANMTIPLLISNGIVAVEDTLQADGSASTALTASTATHIRSKSVPEVAYTLVVDPANVNRILLSAVDSPDAAQGAVTASLGAALETSFTKLVPNGNVVTDVGDVEANGSYVLNATAGDGFGAMYLQQ
jgi:hypothetical protein